MIANTKDIVRDPAHKASVALGTICPVRGGSLYSLSLQNLDSRGIALQRSSSQHNAYINKEVEAKDILLPYGATHYCAEEAETRQMALLVLHTLGRTHLLTMRV